MNTMNSRSEHTSDSSEAEGEEGEESLQLTDRAFGHLFARVLSRALGNPPPHRYARRKQGMMLSLMWAFGIWPEACADNKPDTVRAFRDEVRLTLGTTESQRQIIARVGAAHDLPPFFERGTGRLPEDSPRFTSKERAREALRTVQERKQRQAEAIGARENEETEETIA